MKVGRELDLRVAKEVLQLEHYLPHRPELCDLCAPKPYSASIAAAKEVQQSMAQRGFRWVIQYYSKTRFEVYVELCNANAEPVAIISPAESESEAHAICLAALKAVSD